MRKSNAPAPRPGHELAHGQKDANVVVLQPRRWCDPYLNGVVPALPIFASGVLTSALFFHLLIVKRVADFFFADHLA